MYFSLKKAANDDDVRTGGSKLFGLPDLTYDFAWPTVKVDNEDFDLEFLAQFDLSEIPDAGRKGMLYIFYDLYAMSEGEMLDNESVGVVYLAEPTDLARCAFVSENGEEDEYDDSLGVYEPVYGEGDACCMTRNGDRMTLLSFVFPDSEYGLDGKRVTIDMPYADYERNDFSTTTITVE